MSGSTKSVSPHTTMQAQFQSHLSQMLNQNLTITAFNSLMTMLPPHNISQAKGYLRAILDGAKQSSAAAVLLIQATGKILEWLLKSVPAPDCNDYILKMWEKFKDFSDQAVKKILVLKITEVYAPHSAIPKPLDVVQPISTPANDEECPPTSNKPETDLKKAALSEDPVPNDPTNPPAALTASLEQLLSGCLKRPTSPPAWHNHIDLLAELLTRKEGLCPAYRAVVERVYQTFLAVAAD